MEATENPTKDYYWSQAREPHFERRKKIMEAHPEVKGLFGINTRLKYWTVALVITQLTIAWFISEVNMIWFLV
ncbi:MAG: hypothetical protein AAGB22_02190, partial [Bacteroidota bacterium]